MWGMPTLAWEGRQGAEAAFVSTWAIFPQCTPNLGGRPAHVSQDPKPPASDMLSNLENLPIDGTMGGKWANSEIFLLFAGKWGKLNEKGQKNGIFGW